MLAADKLQLQSALKQQATALKEKEFNLHHSNLMTVGTQAAVLAGLDITMFVEFNPPDDDKWGDDPDHPIRWVPRVLKMVYYGVIVAAFCANMIVVSQTTILSVLGAGLALRGPDGSMMVATDMLFAERKSVFAVFGAGLACTVGSVLIGVWILLRWESALVCWIVSLYTCRTIYQNYERAKRELWYDENETVDFSDIMDGPAAIRAIPTRIRGALGRNPPSRTESGSSHYSRSDSGFTDLELQQQVLIGNGGSYGSGRRRIPSPKQREQPLQQV